MTTEIAANQYTSEERNWAIAAHLSALVAVMGVPFGHIIGPLVVYLTQRDRSPFVASHARASLNFQITVSIAALVFFAVAFAGWAAFIIALPTEPSATMPFFWFLGGWIATACVVLLAVAGIFVLIVMGAVAASNERPYRYPFALSFVR
jgi:uncharacterized Tic20 family protein